MEFFMGDLNLSPSGDTRVVYVSQFDQGYDIAFRILKNEEPYAFSSGTTLAVKGTQPNTSKTPFISYNTTISPDGYYASFTLDNVMTMVDGKCICELVFSLNNTQIGTANFILYVEKSPYAIAKKPVVGDLVSFPSSEEIAQYATRAEAAAEKAEDMANLKDFTAATETTDGERGLVPAPKKSAWDKEKYAFLSATNGWVFLNGPVKTIVKALASMNKVSDFSIDNVSSWSSMEKDPTLYVSQLGNAQLTLSIRSSENAAPGTRYFNGNLSKYRPAQRAVGVGYCGKCIAIGELTQTGDITIRMVGSETYKADASNASNYMDFQFFYVTAAYWFTD